VHQLRKHGDLIVAGLLAVMYVVEASLDADPVGPRGLNVAAALGVTLPLIWHRRNPLAVTVAIAGVSIVQDIFLTSFYQSDAAAFLVQMWLIYLGGARTQGRTAKLTLAAVLVMNLAAGIAEGTAGNAFVATFAPIPLWVAGRGLATRNRLNRELARRSETAGREREAQAALAAAEERVRIAHELQAIVLSEVEGIRALAARRAFAEIAVTGRRALDEMRTLLGVLRKASAAASHPSAAPEPSEAPRPASMWLWGVTLGRLRGTAQDVAVALLWALLLGFVSQTSNGTDPGVPSAVVALVMAAAVFWRRRHPTVVVALMLAVAAVGGAVFDAEVRGVLTLVALFIPLYAAGRHPRSLESRLGVALPLLAGLAVAAMFPLEVWSDLLFPPLYLLLAWLFGRMMYNRERLADVLVDEALRVEAIRDALARAAVVDERLRIARDLHDVGAHSLSMIVLQAEAGKRAAERDPAGAERAAETIAAAADAAIGEVDGLVRGALPQTGLAGIEALAEDARARGLTVATSIGAGHAALSADVESVAYRVVQEALTNVVKHAGPTVVRVTVEVDGEALRVSITDGGSLTRRPDSLHGGGHGLAGMRERCELVGGSLDAGPREDGGFAVNAVLPLAPAAARGERSRAEGAVA
jgi:signal transduction histidine kinase